MNHRQMMVIDSTSCGAVQCIVRLPNLTLLKMGEKLSACDKHPLNASRRLTIYRRKRDSIRLCEDRLQRLVSEFRSGKRCWRSHVTITFSVT